MTSEKPSPSKSPWLTISIGLFGLILGYVIVMGQSGKLASTNQYFCPMEKENCTGNDCNHNA